MFRHKNGMEVELDMYLKLDGNLDLKLVHGIGFEIFSIWKVE
jgi:hypothetical protein